MVLPLAFRPIASGEGGGGKDGGGVERFCARTTYLFF